MYFAVIIGLCGYPAYRLLDLWIINRSMATLPLVFLTLFHLSFFIGTGMVFAASPLGPSSYYLMFGLNIAWLAQLVIARYLDNRKIQVMDDAEIVYFQRQVQEYPENAAYRSALAEAYIARKCYYEARYELEKVVALLPEHSQSERTKLKYLHKMIEAERLNGR